ncbi:Gpi16 subunit, GPI transamidase component [Auricularia subglabra TFB-10046 SS5]|nr:Gpi16 subunit, GPI transamidase component [Auricularia subglabra TFB-10046 SS5]
MRRAIIAVLGAVVVAAAERFDERLELESLPDGKVLAHFSFQTTLDPTSSNDHPQHYTLFPLGLGQILQQHGASELHLSLNAGQWDYDVWRAPPLPGVASGAELWSWLRASNTSETDERWNGLRNALAGVFCASLGSLDSQRTTVPDLSFRPSVPLKGAHELRHATLPSEHVCTENLTPFVKLLPCKANSGLARLLNPHVLFAAPFHGLSVHYARRQLNLAVLVVLTPAAAEEWSLKSLFDRVVPAPCTPASSSGVSVCPFGAQLDPAPSSDANGALSYDMASVAYPFDLSLRLPTDAPITHARSPPAVSIKRTMTGSAQYSGGLLIQLSNAQNDTLRVAYLETLPWFVTLYLHTLDIRLGSTKRPDLLESLSYTPPSERTRTPTTLEPVLRLPPLSRITLEVKLERSFLLYTQHPPDAQRGWDLPPAVVTVLSGHGGGGGQVYARTLLADLATPDFSMPYNVIIMSSTLVALLFGNVFNLLSRAFVLVQAR